MNKKNHCLIALEDAATYVSMMCTMGKLNYKLTKPIRCTLYADYRGGPFMISQSVIWNDTDI